MISLFQAVRFPGPRVRWAAVEISSMKKSARQRKPRPCWTEAGKGAGGAASRASSGVKRLEAAIPPLTLRAGGGSAPEPPRASGALRPEPEPEEERLAWSGCSPSQVGELEGLSRGRPPGVLRSWPYKAGNRPLEEEEEQPPPATAMMSPRILGYNSRISWRVWPDRLTNPPPHPLPPVQRSASAAPGGREGGEPGEFPPSPGAKDASPPRKSPFGTTGTRRLARPPQSHGMGGALGQVRGFLRRAKVGLQRPGPLWASPASAQQPSAGCLAVGGWAGEAPAEGEGEMEGGGGQGPAAFFRMKEEEGTPFSASNSMASGPARQAGRQVAELPFAC